MTSGAAFLVGILGGIASGKSALTTLLCEFGCATVDADALGRDALALRTVKAALSAYFGNGIFGPSGEVDRAALADAAFCGGEEAMAALHGATHPPILAGVERAIAEARPGTALVLDLPLLYECGLWERCDLLVFVDAPMAQRQVRAASRGWGPEELTRREARQAPTALKQAAANFYIKNDKGLDELRNLAKILFGDRIQPNMSPNSFFP